MGDATHHPPPTTRHPTVRYRGPHCPKPFHQWPHVIPVTDPSIQPDPPDVRQLAQAVVGSSALDRVEVRDIHLTNSERLPVGPGEADRVGTLVQDAAHGFIMGTVAGHRANGAAGLQV
jgi:hypothetical protein